jgi:hypothetical protein
MATTTEPLKLRYWRMLAAILGAVLALWLLGGDRNPDAQTLSRGQECREPGFVLATGEIKQATDNSDYFYVGGRLTISAPPRSAAVMRLRSLVGGSYQIVAVAEP